VPLVAFYSRAIATNQPVNEAWPVALNALPNCAKVMKKMSADNRPDRRIISRIETRLTLIKDITFESSRNSEKYAPGRRLRLYHRRAHAGGLRDDRVSLAARRDDIRCE
jgi:hypothetical protein